MSYSRLRISRNKISPRNRLDKIIEDWKNSENARFDPKINGWKSLTACQNYSWIIGPGSIDFIFAVDSLEIGGEADIFSRFEVDSNGLRYNLSTIHGISILRSRDDGDSGANQSSLRSHRQRAVIIINSLSGLCTVICNKL